MYFPKHVIETGAQTTMYAVEAEDLAARGEADPEKDETDKTLFDQMERLVASS